MLFQRRVRDLLAPHFQFARTEKLRILQTSNRQGMSVFEHIRALRRVAFHLDDTAPSAFARERMSR